jgi:hypothetical protein
MIREDTYTHLLGYLTPNQWADAIKQHPGARAEIWALIIIQEATHSFDLRPDVQAILDEEVTK